MARFFRKMASSEEDQLPHEGMWFLKGKGKTPTKLQLQTNIYSSEICPKQVIHLGTLIHPGSSQEPHTEKMLHIHKYD